jgi:hypothetical protein
VPEDASSQSGNDDYDKIFGAGGEATGGGGEEEGFLFDPTEAGPGRIKPGTYRAVILEPPTKQISQNGNPMMKVAFQITDGEYTGQMQWRRYMLSGKAGGWTKEFLEAIGCKDEASGSAPIVPKKLEGRRLLIKVRVQKNDDQYDEVYAVEPHPDGVFGGDGPRGDSPF